MKRTVISLALVLLMLLSLAACGGGTTPSTAPSTDPTEPTAWAPSQAVELVIPYSAGGASDLLGRAVEAVWAKYCDQPVVVTNMPGGGGVTGSMQVSAAKPDGYSLVVGYGSGCDMAMPYLQDMDYDPFEALDPICCLSVHTVMVIAPIDSEFNSMADIVAWAEENQKAITASVSTANGTIDLTFQALRYYADIDINIVPHDGGSLAMTDLLSGSYMIGGGHPSEILPFVQSEQVKILGVATDERDSSMPDIPTLKEQGIDFTSYGSIKGIAVPKNTPDEIKEYYEDLFEQISADEEFHTIMQNMGQPVMYMDMAEFTEYFKNANGYNKQIIEDMGLAYYSK